MSCGKARGFRRFRCKECGKTFGALTDTARSGLHHKERWLAFGASLGTDDTYVIDVPMPDKESKNSFHIIFSQKQQ